MYRKKKWYIPVLNEYLLNLCYVPKIVLKLKYHEFYCLICD